MDKITFKNGSQPALNDTNLNKIQTNIENAINTATEKAFMNAYLGNNQVISKGDNYVIDFMASDSLGNYFELTNKTIKVLKNCTAIISGNVFVDKTAGDNYILSKIQINNKAFSSMLTRITNRDYTTAGIPGKAVSLKAGDVISMKIDYTSDSGNPTIRSDHDTTFLSVTKI